MKLFLLLMGVQGSGKGTQASVLCQAYNLVHVSTGDLFRALRTRDDEFARKIQAIMAAGQLVSDADTNDVLRDHLERTDLKNGVIFDGYPRNIAQADWLASYLAQRGEKLAAVVLLELDLYTAFKRTFGRVSSADDKHSYNIYFNAEGVEHRFVKHETDAFPPRIEATLNGQPLKRRPDDANAGAILNRIDDFIKTTSPLVPYYEGKGLLAKLDALQPIENVTTQIKAIIERQR
ncbi:MAG: nucleoside monophosphate kinase [Armatimonadetes bacterium]|nr:nucleoside monophosphate kinase [Anaerolineae bacterium]